MPRPRDHLANLATSILDSADEIDSPLRRDNLADALEVLLGEPDVDKVLGMPIALWDRLRDLGARLAGLEKLAHLPASTDVSPGVEHFDAAFGNGEVDDLFGNRLRGGVEVAFLYDGKLLVGHVHHLEPNVVHVSPRDLPEVVTFGSGDPRTMLLAVAPRHVVVRP